MEISKTEKIINEINKDIKELSAQGYAISASGLFGSCSNVKEIHIRKDNSEPIKVHRFGYL